MSERDPEFRLSRWATQAIDTTRQELRPLLDYSLIEVSPITLVVVKSLLDVTAVSFGVSGIQEALAGNVGGLALGFTSAGVLAAAAGVEELQIRKNNLDAQQAQLDRPERL